MPVARQLMHSNLNKMFGFSAPAGVLTVQILEGRNLKDKDIIGESDPYIELWLDEDYKQRTSEISNNNNPVWNETYTFNIPEGSSHRKLYMKVYDKDLIGSDKIGEGKVNFEEAYQGAVIDTWVNLPAKLGLTSHGEVHVVISFAPS